MSFLKKILALLLCGAFAFSMLTACGDNQNDTNNQEQEEEESTENEYRDFYEEVFTMAYAKGTDANNFPFWPEPTTEAYERTRNVSEQVEAALNCKLEEYLLPNNNITTFQQMFATGDYTNNWTGAPFASSSSQVNAFYKAGFLQSWNDIPTVDLNNEELWGTKYKQQNATFNGELYLDVGGGSGGGNMGHMIFNKILVNEFNAQNPQELLEQGLWTWDTFEDYVHTISLFEADRTVYAVSIWANNHNSKVMWPLCSILSNGGSIVKKADDGSASFGLQDSEALAALDWASDMLKTGTIKFDEKWPPDTWAKSGSVIVLGDWAFGTSSSGSSAHWGLDNLDDIRFIPFPYGPNAEYGKTSATYASAAGGVGLLFGVDKEDSGYVWNVRKILSVEANDETEEEWKRRTFFQDDPSDDDSYNNYKKGIDEFGFDYSSQLGEDTMKQLRAGLINVVEGTQTSAELFSSISGIIDTAIQENIANN